jgi:hypothetical protein
MLHYKESSFAFIYLEYYHMAGIKRAKRRKEEGERHDKEETDENGIG